MSEEFITDPAPPAEPASGTEPATPPAATTIKVGNREYSVEDASKKIFHADTHISKIEKENEEIRRQLEEANKALSTAKGIDEVLAAIKPQAQQSQEPSDPAHPVDQRIDVEALKAELLEGVKQGLSAEEEARAQQANWNGVVSKLTDIYGSTVNEKVREVSEANGISVEAAKQLAKSTPKVFLKMFDLPQAPDTGVGVRGSVNSAALKGDPNARKGPNLFDAKTSKDKVANFRELLAEYETKFAKGEIS